MINNKTTTKEWARFLLNIYIMFGIPASIFTALLATLCVIGGMTQGLSGFCITALILGAGIVMAILLFTGAVIQEAWMELSTQCYIRCHPYDGGGK